MLLMIAVLVGMLAILVSAIWIILSWISPTAARKFSRGIDWTMKTVIKISIVALAGLIVYGVAAANWG